MFPEVLKIRMQGLNDAINMRKNIFNPTSTFYPQPEPDTPVRKRNHSLGSQPQQPHSPNPFFLPSQEIQPPINSYRRHRIQSKIIKFKSSKANTQLCQENVNIYNTLKKELTSHKLQHITPTACKDNKPKLYIKDIGIVPVESHSLKKRYRTRTTTKCKTQQAGSSKKDSSSSPMREKSIGIKIKNQLRPLLSHSPKKYNQLSLREIVETDEDVQTGYNFFMKLAQLRKRKSSIKDSRRSSDDYSLEGW